MFPAAKAPSVHEASINLRVTRFKSGEMADTATAAARARTRRATPTVNGSVRPNHDCKVSLENVVTRPTRCSSRVLSEEGEAEHHCFDQKFPAPPRKRHPIRDGQARNEQNSRDRHREFHESVIACQFQGFPGGQHKTVSLEPNAAVAGLFI